MLKLACWVKHPGVGNRRRYSAVNHAFRGWKNMQIKTFAAVAAALGALALTAGAAPAMAGGYWDGGNPAIRGGGYCPPPPPRCDCPGRFDDDRAQPFDYDRGEGGYDEDEGFAPSGFDQDYDQDYGQDVSPDFYGAGDFQGGDFDNGGFVGAGPAFGVDVGLNFGDHRRGFFDDRRRFFDRDHFRNRFDQRQRFFDRDHFRNRFDQRQRFFDRDRFNVRQRFTVRQRVNVQQHVFVRQHVQQHFMQQQHVMQARQMRSFGHSMGGHGRW